MHYLHAATSLNLQLFRKKTVKSFCLLLALDWLLNMLLWSAAPVCDSLLPACLCTLEVHLKTGRKDKLLHINRFNGWKEVQRTQTQKVRETCLTCTLHLILQFSIRQIPQWATGRNVHLKIKHHQTWPSEVTEQASWAARTLGNVPVLPTSNPPVVFNFSGFSYTDNACSNSGKGWTIFMINL